MNELAELRLRVATGDDAARLDLVQRLAVAQAPEARDEAMRLLSAACERGEADALMLNATFALRGVGRKQDMDEAFALLAQAAERGSSDAQKQMRVLGGKFDRDVWYAPMQLRQHHAAPRIFTVEKLISPEVCAWFIDYARARLERSTVRDGATGMDVVADGRSADLAGTTPLQTDLVLQLTKLRIAGAIQTHIAHQEPTTILRYRKGQEYLAHYDLIRPQEEAAAAEELRTLGQRIVTVLIYLNHGYEGGETHFPHLNWGFKGKTGDALIFWNMSATGERERFSLHAGMPVKSGRKWLLSQWVRAKPAPLVY
jgi:prolyl 4-hydroxylase